MRNFTKICLLITSICIFNSAAYSYPIGYSDTLDSGVLQTIKNTDNTPIKLQKTDFTSLTPKNYPLLIFSNYGFIDDYTYNSIYQYIQKGGKIILITPALSTDEKNFIKLSKLVGVRVDKIQVLQTKTDVHWVEKTVSDNMLKENSKIAKVSLYPNTTHLAVFGDIEKHESAVSLNSNGSLVSWQLGKDGSKQLNEKSLKYILEELLPKNTSKTTFSKDINCKEDIEKLNSNMEFIEKYNDNIINYSIDNSLSAQNMELSKINGLWATFYAKTGDTKNYQKYLKCANDNLCASMKGVKPLSPMESRGIWFDRGTIVNIKSKAEMGRYFDKIQRSGINTVYFETLNAGYTIYPSKIATQNPLTKGHDPLVWAVSEAHARKIKLHAWLWIFAVGNDRHNKIINRPNDYVGPVLEKNMRWAMLGENGNFRPKNQPEFWIDPSNREAVNFVLKISDEIVKKYDVDGIQLDYIRYPFQSPENLMGFNHNSMEEYSIKTGEKLFVNNYQTNVMWNKWKEANINSFVRKITKQTKEVRPSVKISASVFSKTQTSRLNSIQQNWENWIDNKYIDSLTPMSYSVSVDALNTNLAPLKQKSSDCMIFPGIALQHVDEKGILEQLEKIYEEGFCGVSLFALAQLNDEKSSVLNATANPNNIDISNNKKQSAISLMEEYKLMLTVIQKNTYDLSSAQKSMLNTMNSEISQITGCVKNGNKTGALNILSNLQVHNNDFFKNYSAYNAIRKQTATSYLKRAENLIKMLK